MSSAKTLDTMARFLAEQRQARWTGIVMLEFRKGGLRRIVKRSRESFVVRPERKK